MSLPFSIAIHGGAGSILPENLNAELEADIRAVLKRSVVAGYALLSSGGDALDAAVASVKILEDSPHFNAGKGSVLTAKEMVEMDASVMHGHELKAGAIAGVRHIENPVELARDVMNHCQHVFLIGEGAEEFAFSRGYSFTEQDYFFTERRYEQLMALKASGKLALSGAQDSDAQNLEERCQESYPDDNKHGTVGAVALDQHGNLAAATSTGGIANKKFGRVGDSAIIGAGTLAENGNVAVSATGMGEVFIRKRVASDIAARMRYLGESVKTASESVIHGELKALGGEGGVIAIDHQGQLHSAFNCTGMYRASIDIDGQIRIKIFADE